MHINIRSGVITSKPRGKYHDHFRSGCHTNELREDRMTDDCLATTERIFSCLLNSRR